ncbi:MAG: EAL domain-containing protein [Cellulosilyticaceae bacterium]
MYKKKINILIIDSNKEIETILKVLLQSNENHYFFFTSDTLSDDRLAKSNYQLVIMHIHDKLKGLDLLQHIKKDIPIVGIFEKHMGADLQVFYEAGLTDWLMKPYTSLQLGIRINHHIEYMELKNRCINSEVLFHALLNNVPYMSWFKNKTSQYMKVNNEFKYHCDKNFEQIEGKDDCYVWNGKIGEQCRAYDLQVMNERKPVVFNEVIPGKRGERLFEVHKAPVVDADDEVVGTVGIARDITETVRVQQQIEQMAYTDDLTQLKNRRGLYKYFEEIKKRQVKEVTMFYLDLDNFKAINDSYGHYYGDQVLIELASKLMKLCEESIIARLGGDEFVVVFTSTITKEEVCKKASKLIEGTRTSFTRDEKRHVVSVSVGIAQGSLEEDTVENILLRSDLALYEAKEKGKNQYIIYTSQIENTYRQGMELEQAIYRGMLNQEFILHYQPQYTTNQELKGFEALLRWENEHYKHIPISKVIEILEATKQMQKMGDIILQQAFRFAKKINEGQLHALIISVNISPLQLMEKRFVKKVQQLLQQIDISPKIIAMEITENVLLEDMNTNIKKLQELKDLGISIALDDFGTGYSSLNYLSKLPLSAIKINKSFVKEMQVSDAHHHMTRTITQMAFYIKVEVVAEGVEHEEQLALLKEMEVNYIQGYLWGRPMREEEALHLAKRSKKDTSF